MESSAPTQTVQDPAHGVGDRALELLAKHAHAGRYTVIPAFDHHGAFASASLICARIRTKREFRSCGGRVLIFGPDRRLHSWTDLKPGRLSWKRA